MADSVGAPVVRVREMVCRCIFEGGRSLMSVPSVVLFFWGGVVPGAVRGTEVAVIPASDGFYQIARQFQFATKGFASPW